MRKCICARLLGNFIVDAPENHGWRIAVAADIALHIGHSRQSWKRCSRSHRLFCGAFHAVRNASSIEHKAHLSQRSSSSGVGGLWLVRNGVAAHACRISNCRSRPRVLIALPSVAEIGVVANAKFSRTRSPFSRKLLSSFVKPESSGCRRACSQTPNTFPVLAEIVVHGDFNGSDARTPQSSGREQ